MLGVVILVHNRRDALERTLSRLGEVGVLGRADVVVVDNASTDDPLTMVRDRFGAIAPRLTCLRLDENTGVNAFNKGVSACSGDPILILDDDAWPDTGALEAAEALLAQHAGVGGVALHPVHPGSRQSEWPHAKVKATGWPFMGCGNLVRRAAWDRVGGYEADFFLYRNDVDLALKLLAAGFDVAFDPAWVVWHDSPAAAHKSQRWLELASRNWVWIVRRHGRGLTALLGFGAGLMTALRHAGPRPGRVWSTIRGFWRGLTEDPPAVPDPCNVDGVAFHELLRRRLRNDRPPV